jgi:asparagine synthase (glutamine-hydrolysing)
VCGIAGIASLTERPVDPQTIRGMTDVLAHRGPDDAGYAYFRIREGDPHRGSAWAQFADERFAHHNENLPVFGGRYYRDEIAKQSFALALGHRRLSIIDLSPYGHQPMASANHRYWLTYNGEIYNYRELRDELVARGYVFRTRTDSEVLLHTWEEFGPEGLARLDGMFAFGLYDTWSNTLHLARDRYGVKPLYYAAGPHFLAFGSEVKAVLASGAVSAQLDPASLVEYLTFQNNFTSQTLFQRVHMLPPGTVLTVKPVVGAVSAPVAYVATDHQADAGLAHDQGGQAAQVAALFEQAVRGQLVSDVEVGAYLSGGMDSGSIVAVAGRQIPRLLTFTAGFDLTNVNGIEQGFDERPMAERLSYLLQTEHYDVVLHAGDMPAAMERVAWHMDDPRVGMCHQNWYAAKLASKFVKVCLAGAGGDELFGGYPWRYRPALTSSSAREFDEHYLRYWHRLLAPEELGQLFAPELRPLVGPVAEERFGDVMRRAPEADDRLSMADNLIQRALYFEYKTFLHGFLVTEDRMSMAHSLETRVPFLDNKLSALAWRLPPSLKLVGDAEPSGAVGKQILRRAMETVLPREFLQQKKQGFSPPDENWYRGPSMDYIKTILLDPRARQRPWFDQTFYAAKLDEHFQGRRNHRLLIWSLLSLEWLQRHFVDGRA